MSFNGVRARGGGGGAPLGAVIIWTQSENPEDWENWHDCDGTSIAGSQLCTEKGVCVAPDYKGMFLRGLGGRSGALNELQQDDLKKHEHQYYYICQWCSASWWVGTGGVYIGPRASPTFASSSAVGGDETRPVNKAVRYLIRINE